MPPFTPAPTFPAAALRRALRPAALLAAALALAPVARAATPAPADAIVVVSTSDVKAKNLPCGCHVPKGGLSRRAAFGDSLRALYPDLLVVDSGGFFPEQASEPGDAAFMAGAMHDLGITAATLGDRELAFGPGFLDATLKASKLPVVSANVWRKFPSRAPFAKPWVLQKSGRWTVGVFGLASPEARAGDSLEVSDPTEAAKAAVAEMRQKGANVVVLLSSLGRTETESLVLSVPGIDLAVAGRNIPLLQRSRQVGETTVAYGGEQGQYAVVTKLGLDEKGAIVSRDSEAIMLGPDVRDQPAMLAKVTAYEEQPDVKARHKPQAAASDTTTTSMR